MAEFGDRTSQRYSERMEDVKCPLCKKATVRATFISGWMEWKVSRIASGAKRTPFFHDPRIKVHSSCPQCKASREDIKRALERGGEKMTHEERLKRIQEAGLPTMLEY